MSDLGLGISPLATARNRASKVSKLREEGKPHMARRFADELCRDVCEYIADAQPTSIAAQELAIIATSTRDACDKASA